MQDVVGTKPSKWCAGCHDHAVFFNGRFDRPIKEQIDTPEAQAGLACTSCHSITHVGSTMGQGDFEIEYPPLHDLAASENPVRDASTTRCSTWRRSRIAKRFSSRFTASRPPSSVSTATRCTSTCPVNGYRWFRGFNDYDNWQASGVSGQGARSFYYPAEVAEMRGLPYAARRFERSGGEERKGAVASVSGRQHRAAVRQSATRCSSRPCRISCATVRSPSTSSASRARRNDGGDGSVTRREAGQAASTFAVGEESAKFGASQAIQRATGRRAGSARQDSGDRPPRRVGSRRSRRANAESRPLLSRRHGRRLRRLGRARSGGRQGTRAAPQRRSRRRREGAGRSRRAFLSQPSARRTRQPDQQAQRLDDAVGRLRPADSSRRGRHGALPARNSPRMRATRSSCGPR